MSIPPTGFNRIRWIRQDIKQEREGERSGQVFVEAFLVVSEETDAHVFAEFDSFNAAWNFEGLISLPTSHRCAVGAIDVSPALVSCL